jgi:Na+/proline symporter/signal transduction histidine kinase/ActR/RegA family two-component response regulator
VISGWILLLVSVGYVGLLFAVAWWGDRRPLYPVRIWLRPLVYSLALAVYCSSWTFYGAVGTAARTGLGFLPIYLGPLLLLLFAWRILERLALIARERNTVSIADFIAARYGRAPALAAFVAAVAVIAAIPYVALQFKAVAMSLDVLAATEHAPAVPRGVLADPALYVAALLAVFAILFGTRRIDATEHHHGMMLAVALESLVKLIAFVAVGTFAFLQLPGSESLTTRALDAARTLSAPGLPHGFVAQTLLAFAAIICLPRQFQVAVVECENVADVRRARLLFGAYLILVCAMVVPITVSGQALLAGSAEPDAYVLALPLSAHSTSLTLVAYIGGLSAATGMVIVASVALATMVSNDLVLPLLFRRGLLHPEHGPHFSARVLWIRRAAIVAIAALAYSYYRLAGNGDSLAAYGLLAFAAVAQFAPALIGGLYWRDGSRNGALAGLCAGFALWGYTLLLPALTRALGTDVQWLTTGPLGLHWLRPEGLFGVQGWDAITHGTFWSLLANVGAFLIVSARSRPSFEERLLVTPYLDPYSQRSALATDDWHGSLTGADLQRLAARVVGETHAQQAFAEYFATQGRRSGALTPADPALVQFTERLLAASIGAASARVTLTSALRGSGMELDEVVALLDEAGQELRFNRQLLTITFEKMAHGISVVDADLRLVAWNQRYQEMFDYPQGMLYIGRPVAELIRYNVERGLLGQNANVDAEVNKRLAHLRHGHSHIFVRERSNGRVIESRGEPLPAGGYVMTFNDITDYKRVEHALRESNETLEQRVAQRTREAEAAHASKTRFLAAISHDVLQPLHAARLFASALRTTERADEQQRLAERVDTALRAAEELLDGLLDISRLDAGALQPELTDFHLDELAADVAEQYAPVADARGLTLRVRRSGLVVRSDRRLLRRALQNFVGNALRYTERGGVLIGVRRREAHALVQVWDSGPGIPPQHMPHIFEEFRRFEPPSPWNERGLGLGLAICQRVSSLLGHPLGVRSRLGRGSVFSIRVPVGSPVDAHAAPEITPHDRGLEHTRVLCLDNDREILEGMRSLLSRWGVGVQAAETVQSALELARDAPADVFLVDYHLPESMNGLDAIDALRTTCGREIPAALVTADGSDALLRAARDQGCTVLTKPLKPAALRAFLAAISTSLVRREPDVARVE